MTPFSHIVCRTRSPLAGQAWRASAAPRHQLAGVVLVLLLNASGASSGAEHSALPAESAQPSILKIEQREEWFEVYRILPGVYSIREPGHWERVISYLVVGTERALLFDSGTGIGDIRSVVSALTDLSVIVVNSHSHADHIGGNYQFEQIYGLDLETTARNSQGKTVEESRWFVPSHAFSREPPLEFSRQTYRIRPYRITRYLQDKEVIDLGDRALEVVLAPGHAADALCLLDREQRFILTGDTFYLGRLFIQSEPSSLSSYAASVTRLAALAGEVDRVLPAHSTTLLKAFFLTRLGEAFESIHQGIANSQEREGSRKEYLFENFSIVVPEIAFRDP